MITFLDEINKIISHKKVNTENIYRVLYTDNTTKWFYQSELDKWPGLINEYLQDYNTKYYDKMQICKVYLFLILTTIINLRWLLMYNKKIILFKEKTNSRIAGIYSWKWHDIAF